MKPFEIEMLKISKYVITCIKIVIVWWRETTIWTWMKRSTKHYIFAVSHMKCAIILAELHYDEYFKKDN
jgi:hypothetical protein